MSEIAQDPESKPLEHRPNPWSTMKEIDFGIEMYVGDQPGAFKMNFKSRWEDFHVREIDPDGNVATLKDLNPPLVDQVDEPPVMYYFSDGQITELNRLLAGEIPQMTFPASCNKPERAAIHAAIRKFSDKLFTGSVVNADGQFIVAKLANYADSENMSKPELRFYSKDKPFCRFVVFKQGIDTMHALSLLARYFNMKPDRFSYAGTKDKRAFTYQFVTAKYVNIKRLAGLNSRLFSLKVGEFTPVPRPLFLGDLIGNRFDIVLRAVETGDESAIITRLDALKQHGFINYFGLQRFGHNASVSTWKIGALIMKSDWRSVVEMILEPTPEDLTKVREAKIKFRENPHLFENIQDEMPQSFEKDLMMAVSKHGFNEQAVLKLPRNLRSLYGHSYQSLLWNRVVSKRIKKFALKVLPGDLVLETQAGMPKSGQSRKRPHDDGSVVQVKKITENEVNNYSIEDVILPLPGHNIIYPDNETNSLYTSELEEAGLTTESFKHRIKEFRLPGSYRNILVKPQLFEYRFESYTDPNVSLIPTDVDVTVKKRPSPPPEESDSMVECGPQRALIVSFSLPKSAYATMAIREISSAIKIGH